MHIAHNNMQSKYNMSDQQLKTTDQQRDLGIIITKDLTWQKQTEKSCKTDNGVLGVLGQRCTGDQIQKQRADAPVIQIHIPPASRTCSEILVPKFKANIDKIEKIQRKTKMIPEIRNHRDHQQIQYLDLISLVHRRLRGQLIEVFKIPASIHYSQCKRALRLRP